MDATAMVKLTDLSHEDLTKLKIYFDEHGPNADFSQAHYDAIVTLLAEKPAPAQPASESLGDLQAWARQRVRAAAPRAAKPDVVTEPEVAPSIKDRPKTINDIVGQKDLVGQLRMVAIGAKTRGTEMPHVLLVGPSGHGKTTMAGVVAQELGKELIVVNGMMLKKPSDLVGILVKMKPRSCLFIDEVHGMNVSVQEVLYQVLEDGFLTTVMGTGMDAQPFTHQMEDFTCIAATTRPGLLAAPFRGRFGLVGTVSPYSEEELAEIISRAWTRGGATFAPSEALNLARACKGVPRRALHLCERVLDYCVVMEEPEVSEGTVHGALASFQINEIGLDEADLRILGALTGPFAGRSVGVDALASFLDMDPKTIVNEAEPFLCQKGYVSRGKTGRMALQPAYELLDVDAPAA